MFNNHSSGIGSASTSDRNILAYGSFNIWWRNVTKKKLSANLYSNREIRFVRVFSVRFLNDYVRGNQFSKVIHDQSGKYLLGNVLHLVLLNRSFRVPNQGYMLHCKGCCGLVYLHLPHDG